MMRSVREMSAARRRSPERKTSIDPRSMPSNISAMRKVSRAAFANATLALSSAAVSRWMGFPGWAGKKPGEEPRETIGEGEGQHRERQVEGGVEIDDQTRRRGFDMREQPGN